MDSGNSGSLRSSSGCDDEYSSRLNCISPLLHDNNNNNNNNSSFSSSSFFSSISNHAPTLFDPENNLQTFSYQNPLYNLDSYWSRNLRSELDFTDFASLTSLQTSASISASTTQSLLQASASVSAPTTQSLLQTSASVSASTTQSLLQGLTRGSFPIQSSADDAVIKHDQTNIRKNPKKRTRASRRAPTTVLTTDTSNFRQMVQEFTGIPAAQFTSTAYSGRLDLFGSRPDMRSTAHLDSLYSPQKVQPPLSSSPATSLLGMQNNPMLGFQQLQSESDSQNLGGFNGSGDALQVRESDGSTRWRDSSIAGGGKGTVDSWILPSDD